MEEEKRAGRIVHAIFIVFVLFFFVFDVKLGISALFIYLFFLVLVMAVLPPKSCDSDKRDDG